MRVPRPMPQQSAILVHPARHKVCPCGRRWGKTGCGLIACVKGHGPHTKHLKGALDGGQIWWIAPTFTVGQKIWRDLKRSCEEAAIEKSETEKRIVLPGDGSVTVKSADAEKSLVGEGLDGLVLDETGFVREIVWKEYLRPTLSDKQGWSLMIGTPNGRNWYHDVFEDAATRRGWARWQRPSSDNPLMTPEELHEAYLDVGPRAFAQQYEARFMDMEGAEFLGSYFNDVWFDEWPNDLVYKVLTLDPSKGKSERSDYSAYVMLGLDAEGTMYADANLERRDTVQIVSDGIGLARTWNPTSFAIETNTFQELFLELFARAAQEKGMLLPTRPVVHHMNKETRIRGTLTPFLSRGEIKFRRTRGGKMLVDQLQQFPQGQHDDGPDALEMAVSEVKRLYLGA